MWHENAFIHLEVIFSKEKSSNQNKLKFKSKIKKLDQTNRIFVASYCKDNEFGVVYVRKRFVYSNEDNVIIIKNNNKV